MDEPHVADLIARIKNLPVRSEADPRLSDLARSVQNPGVSAIFEAWAQHRVDRLEVGHLVMADTFIEDSFWLPRFPKATDPDDADFDEPRDDVVVFGRLSGTERRYVGAYRATGRPVVVDVYTASDIPSATLEELLQREMNQGSR